MTPYDRDGYKYTFIECKEVVEDEARHRTLAMPFSIRVPGYRKDLKPGDLIFVGSVYGVDLKPFWYKISPTSEMFTTSVCLFVDNVILLTKEQKEAHYQNDLNKKIKNAKEKSGKEEESTISKKVKKKIVPPTFLPF